MANVHNLPGFPEARSKAAAFSEKAPFLAAFPYLPPGYTWGVLPFAGTPTGFAGGAPNPKPPAVPPSPPARRTRCVDLISTDDEDEEEEDTPPETAAGVGETPAGGGLTLEQELEALLDAGNLGVTAPTLDGAAAALGNQRKKPLEDGL